MQGKSNPIKQNRNNIKTQKPHLVQCFITTESKCKHYMLTWTIRNNSETRNSGSVAGSTDPSIKLFNGPLADWTGPVALAVSLV
jgi:hypothetical protein